MIPFSESEIAQHGISLLPSHTIPSKKKRVVRGEHYFSLERTSARNKRVWHENDFFSQLIFVSLAAQILHRYGVTQLHHANCASLVLNCRWQEGWRHGGWMEKFHTKLKLQINNLHMNFDCEHIKCYLQQLQITFAAIWLLSYSKILHISMTSSALHELSEITVGSSRK